jgi:hypothetical protein
MLRIPKRADLSEWVKETIDECMGSSQERGMVYTRASQYYYMGTQDSRAAIYNKTKAFIDKMAGFLMQPTDVRFNVVFDSGEPDDVLERGELTSEKLTADYRQTDSDITFAEAVVWSLVNGCQILKTLPNGESFRNHPIHPQNFGVLSETTLGLEEQEAVCHVSFPTFSRMASLLEEIDHPQREAILRRILEARREDRDEEPPTYFHSMVVGGMQPAGDPSANKPPEAAGIVNVFGMPQPWRPQKRVSRTLRHCELWVKDADRDGDWTTIQCIYGADPIVIEGDRTHRNLSRVPGRLPFTKLQAQPTPGYFWGRSLIADVQMLQELLNKRLRDLKVMWDRNVNAAQVLSGFTSVTEEMYFKILNEGGFLNDPNPNAKAAKLVEPPPQGYLEELDFIFRLFDEASGFTPVMSGQGEPGVRAGVHAQTLVRTSSPRLIDQAARIERQLAENGWLSLRVAQAMDPLIYVTETGQEFFLHQLPGSFQVQVDSHSASPAFAEDNRQVAIALARAGAIDAEDLIHMLHPPGAELLLARLRKRKKAQAAEKQHEEQKEIIENLLQFPKGGRRGPKGRRPA